MRRLRWRSGMLSYVERQCGVYLTGAVNGLVGCLLIGLIMHIHKFGK
jgi:hypothetical protein